MTMLLVRASSFGLSSSERAETLRRGMRPRFSPAPVLMLMCHRSWEVWRSDWGNVETRNFQESALEGAPVSESPPPAATTHPIPDAEIVVENDAVCKL